jgi:hypothetical protein
MFGGNLSLSLFPPFSTQPGKNAITQVSNSIWKFILLANVESWIGALGMWITAFGATPHPVVKWLKVD